MAARTQLWAFLSKLKAKQKQYMVFFSSVQREDRKEKKKAKEDLYIKLRENGNWQLAKTVVN